MYGGSFFGSSYGGGAELESGVQKVALLQDNYDDNSTDLSKWLDSELGAATINEQNQRLEIALPSSADNGDYARRHAVSNWDLSESAMSLRIVEVPNTATAANGSFVFSITQDGLNWVRWVVESGIWYAQYMIAGSRNTLGFLPHDASTAYIKIREASGTLYFETSPTGQSDDWTVQFTFTWGSVFGSLAAGTPDIEGYAYQPETDPGNFIVDSFNITPNAQDAPSIAFEGDAELTVVSPNVNVQVNNPLPRTYEYKVFDKDGNFIGVWPDVISDFGYGQDINTAGAAIQVQLGRSIDTPFNDPVRLLTEADPIEHILTEADEFLQGDYQSPNRVGEGTDVAVNNRVEVWEYYGSLDNLVTSDTFEDIVTTQGDEPIQVHYGAPNGRRAFHGIIQEFEADYGSTDIVVVTIASFGIQLDNYVLKIGETTTVPQNSKDPAATLRFGIENYRAQGGEMNYSPGSIRDTGNVTSVTFRLNTILEVAKKALQMSPSDWYWYGDVADDDVWLQPRPATVAHRFTLGDHIIKGKFKQSMLNMLNLYYFVGGEVTPGNYLFKKYLNQTSIDDFGQQLKRETDQRFTDEDSVSLISNSAIDSDKNPRYAGSIDITSATYPIETVRLGELIGFANFGNFIDDLTLVVAGIKFTPDVLTLKLEVLPPKIDKRIEDIRRNLNTQEQLTTPDTPS